MSQQSLMDMKIHNTPAQFSKLMRDMGDVFWWDKGNFWVVTSHEYAKSVLMSDDFTCDRSSFFVSRMPEMDLSLITDFFAVVGKMMVMSDAPAHTQRRRICYDGFTAQALQKLEGTIKQNIAKQISLMKQNNRIELVEDLAKIIPSTTLAEFFNIPESERNNFYNWSNNMTQFFGGSSAYQNADGIEVNNSAKNLRAYFTSLIADRKSNPQNDFLSILLKNQHAFGLTDDEIVSQTIMMLVAGQVTTTDQLCNNMYTLLSDEKAQQQLWNTPEIVETAVDELNRLDPAVTFIFRVTKNDTMIGSQAIKKGEVIFISTHAVNRDPAVFEEPDSCILTRKNNKHISYGYGSHYCLGAKLARIEMEMCFTSLMKAFPQLRFSEDNLPARKHHSLAFSGFESMHLDFSSVKTLA
jgi:cytochrome P450